MDGTLPGTAHKFYIDGQWVDPVGRAVIEVVDPTTEEVFGSIAGGNAADVDRAVAAARRAFESYSLWSREERLALLRRIVAVYTRRQEEMAQALTREMGVPISYARSMQVPIVIWGLEAIAKVLESYEFDDGSQGADRGVRPHHAVELAAQPHRRQGRARAGYRLHHRAEAQRDGAFQRAPLRRGAA